MARAIKEGAAAEGIDAVLINVNDADKAMSWMQMLLLWFAKL